MEIINQRILILDNDTGLGETLAQRIALLGAKVVRFTHRAIAPATDHGLIRTSQLDSFRRTELENHVRELAEPIDHLLIGQLFPAAAPAGEYPESDHPWLGGPYGWAYDFCRRRTLPRVQSVAFFPGPVVIPAGQEAAAAPREVEAGYVRWLDGALRPVRVNAVRTEPVPSPLPALPDVQARQALYMSSAPTTRSRQSVQEDVAEALLFLIRSPHLSGSVLNINPTATFDW